MLPRFLAAGLLVSRPVDNVLREAGKLAIGGASEGLLVPQDTSVCGVDVKYAPREWHGKQYQTRMKALCEGPGGFADVRIMAGDGHELYGEVRDD